MDDYISINSDAAFRALALERFALQARLCEPYRQYLELIGCDVESVKLIEDIPFLPIELFKSCKIYCGDDPAEAIFTSSGGVSSHHYMSSLANYERAFRRAFELFYGDIREWGVYALLPSYLEREGSSLIYMMDRLIELAGVGGFYLYDHATLLEDMRRCTGRRKLLIGVSYALLDLAEGGLVGSGDLADVVIMETGGMKGQRKELHKSELHRVLTSAFGVDKIHSEYGMAELTSQGYSSGDGLFYTPPWMRVLIRDLADPFAVSDVVGRRGGVNIIDLASEYSCSFIQTQDLGVLRDGGGFEIDGRISGSDIRGCNLLI